MRVLLIGSGGRESALSWKIAQSSMLESLFNSPRKNGNKQKLKKQ
ncbi:MAG: Phosphoribosylglycinamide synthetase, domain, partial [Bacteroidota bacterium]